MLDLRTWLRSHPLLAAPLSAQRVWFRVPTNPSGSPFIRIYRAGGGPQPSEAPIQDIRIAHEVWALLDEDYTLVLQTIQALESIYQQASNLRMGTGTVLLNAEVTGVVDSPDPDSGWPRIVLDVLATVSL